MDALTQDSRPGDTPTNDQHIPFLAQLCPGLIPPAFSPIHERSPHKKYSRRRLKQLPWIHHAFRVERRTDIPDGLHPQRSFFNQQVSSMVFADTVLVTDRPAVALDGPAGSCFHRPPALQQLLGVRRAPEQE